MEDIIFSIIDNYKYDIHNNIIVKRVSFDNNILKFLVHDSKKGIGICYKHTLDLNAGLCILLNNFENYFHETLNHYCDLAYFYLNFIDGYNDEKHGKYLETYLKLCRHLRKQNKR